MEIEPHHVGLSVRNLDAVRSWYADAFGFATHLEFTLPDGTRGAMLSTPAAARIELFEVPDSAGGLRDADPPTAMRTAGYGHVALATHDLDAALASALAAGGSSVWDPRPAPEPGHRIAFVHDPEGNLVELIGS